MKAKFLFRTSSFGNRNFTGMLANRRKKMVTSLLARLIKAFAAHGVTGKFPKRQNIAQPKAAGFAHQP